MIEGIILSGLSEGARRKVALVSPIYESSFKIAGGLVLLVLSIRELVIYGEDKGKIGDLGVVPIGIPL